MILVTAADDAFAPGVFVLIHSAHLHNPSASFYVLDSGLSAENQNVLTTFCTTRGIPCHIVSITQDLSGYLNARHHWSASIFSRLFIPALLPATVGKALYLDADTVVTGPLAPLWEVPLADNLVAGVPDDFVPSEEVTAAGVTKGRYINSGVLLMNLSLWRSESTAKAVFAFLEEHHEHIMYLDQTAMNAVCKNRVLFLPATSNFFAPEYARLPFTNPPILPTVIHYVGKRKPWAWANIPFGEVYEAHRQHIPTLAAPTHNGHTFKTRKRQILGLISLKRKYWLAHLRYRAYTAHAIHPYLRSLQK